MSRFNIKKNLKRVNETNNAFGFSGAANVPCEIPWPLIMIPKCVRCLFGIIVYSHLVVQYIIE